MNKYIRTNDDVFIVEKETELYILCCNGHTKRMYAKEENNPLLCGCDFIGTYETADTIEELCDAVVIKKTNTLTNKTWYSNYPMELYKAEKRSMVNTLLEYIKIDFVKFAIWTSKGLIYVAKMKENGELELI